MSWWDGLSNLFSWDNVGKAIDLGSKAVGVASQLGAFGGNQQPKYEMPQIPRYEMPKAPSVPEYGAWTPLNVSGVSMPKLFGGITNPSDLSEEQRYSMLLSAPKGTDVMNPHYLNQIMSAVEAKQGRGELANDARFGSAVYKRAPRVSGDPYRDWRHYIETQVRS